MTPIVHDALDRAVRNAVQVIIPTLTLASTGVVDLHGLGPVAVTALLAGTISILKTLSGLTASTDTPPLTALAERAAGAAAGAVVALFPQDYAGAIGADWAAIGTAALGAAVLSLAMGAFDVIPADEPGDHALSR